MERRSTDRQQKEALHQCGTCCYPDDEDDETTYTCRVCFEETSEKGELVQPCSCKGTQRYVHYKCLRKWQENVIRKSQEGFGISDERAYVCSVCQTPFSIPPIIPQQSASWCKRILSCLCAISAMCLLSIFVLSLISLRRRSLLLCFFVFACTAVFMMPRGLRMVLRMDALGHFGLMFIRQGAPIEGLGAGVLLVASDELEYTMFRQSVIFLYKHNSYGAAGIILTKRLEPRVLFNYNPGDPLRSSPFISHFAGGPVGMPHGGRPADHQVLLHDFQAGYASLEVPMEGGRCIYISTQAREAIHQLDNNRDVVNPEHADIRLYHGISSWAGGQLEGEIRSTSWGFCNATWEDLQGDTETLWHRLVVSPRMRWM